MPRGKELEQLPMANTLAGMGEDRSKFDRDVLSGIFTDERPMPAKVKENQSSN
ncbi:hypothetical protein [Mesobacillus selenatarsenatis]|uniref:Uncharacterized protein n=1 Tax=Mesobacillus selenatarsenatis (strain DSM 18680 / JCM 14380 / FERM P-15431 / SF-1) TaxID=1321606 RepID=A0A0A8X0M3_MESS1|nr:hypothetical protein [Mesobacillus selenatarsenatis]GAM13535.1 hypothetical protein SAMD00020551_1680 [Mesobacillus selenatarsenatis SF-1]